MDKLKGFTVDDVASKYSYAIEIPDNVIDVDKAENIEDIKHILKNMMFQPRHDKDIDEKFKHLWVRK